MPSSLPQASAVVRLPPLGCGVSDLLRDAIEHLPSLARLEPVTGLIGAENVAPREAVRPFPEISYFESCVGIFCLFACDVVALASSVRAIKERRLTRCAEDSRQWRPSSKLSPVAPRTDLR